MSLRFAPRRGWLAAFRAWRERVLSDPGFQRASMRMILTRPIARRRMRALFDLCSGFVYSQVLFSCTRLGLFERLAESPASAEDLARTLDLSPAAMQRLLDAAVSLQLLERRGLEQFGLGSLGAALRGNPAVAMMIEHHGRLYQDLTDPVALLRGNVKTTELQQFWAYAASESPKSLESGKVAHYTELMAASQEMIADQVLRAFPVHRRARLLDVGGGSGAFALAALRRSPTLTAEVFDLPAVAEQAQRRFEREGMAARGRAIGGDFLSDPLPKNAELVTLVRILHDHNDDAVLALLKRVRAALAPGGILLVAEPMLGTRGSEPVAAAYFGFYLLAMGQGRPRSPEMIESLLRQAGFGSMKMHPTSAPLLVRVLSAQPSSSDT